LRRHRYELNWLGPGVALGFSLVAARIFVRLGVAGPDLVIIVQHRVRVCLFLLGGHIDQRRARPRVSAAAAAAAHRRVRGQLAARAERP
jgi:hypothetical protein